MKHLFLTILAITVFGVYTSIAQNPHFVSGPTITNNGATITACGSIAGLGNSKGTVIVLSVPETITTDCINPGNHQVEAQTKTVTATVKANYTSDKNGKVSFCLTTPAEAAGKCPGKNWTSTVTVAYGQATITVNGTTMYP